MEAGASAARDSQMVIVAMAIALSFLDCLLLLMLVPLLEPLAGGYHGVDVAGRCASCVVCVNLGGNKYGRYK